MDFLVLYQRNSVHHFNIEDLFSHLRDKLSDENEILKSGFPESELPHVELEECLENLHTWRYSVNKCIDRRYYKTWVIGLLTKIGNCYLASYTEDRFENSIINHGLFQLNHSGNFVSKITQKLYLETTGKVYPLPEIIVRESLNELTLSSPVPCLPPIRNIRSGHGGWHILIGEENRLYCLYMPESPYRFQNPYLDSRVPILNTKQFQIYQFEFKNVRDADYPDYRILTVLFDDGIFRCYKVNDDSESPKLMAEIENIHEMERLRDNKYLLTTTDGKLILVTLERNFFNPRSASFSTVTLPWDGFWTLRPINSRVKSARS